MGSGYLRDFGSVVEVGGTVLAEKADGAAAQSKTDIDTNNCRGLYVIVDLHDRNSTGTWTVKLQESATAGGSYSDVSGATTAALAANAVTEYDWSGLNSKRYIKLVGTAGTAGVGAAATLLLLDSQVSPNPK